MTRIAGREHLQLAVARRRLDVAVSVVYRRPGGDVAVSIDFLHQPPAKAIQERMRRAVVAEAELRLPRAEAVSRAA